MKTAQTAFMLLMITVLAGAVSCRLKVPLKEMSLAKSAITRAGEVKADKYAPDDLKRAKEFLSLSHADIKKEDTSKAEENAKKSLAYGTDAINKSLPLLSKDTLDEAKKLIADAERMNAERYASSDFSDARSKAGEAEKLHGDKSFWESYLVSKKAIAAATAARDKAEARIPELQNRIASIRGEADNLKSARGSEFASSELAQVSSRLDAATAGIGQKNLKDASRAIDDAESALNRAKGNTKRGIAAEKIRNAEKELDIANSSKMKDQFAADIQRASTLITNAKSDLSSGSFDAAATKADEATALLKSANSNMTVKAQELKKTAQEKLEAAENALKKIKESPLASHMQADIDAVQPLIDQSRGFLNKDAYQDSIAKSDKALARINQINIAMEKKAEELRLKGDTSKEAKEEQVYVVKYNPKKRDCLWRIAYYVYKDAKLWPVIYTANKDKIKDPDLIFPGQKFSIPSMDKKADDAGKKEKGKPPVEGTVDKRD